MNAHRERRHLAGLFSMTAVVLVALWVFGLYPAHRHQRQLQSDIDDLDGALSAFAQRDGEPTLDAVYADLRRSRRTLEAEYQALLDRVQTFSGASPIGDSLPSTEEGRIDFKVALHDARSTLLQSAAEAGMALPARLGIQETIEEQENPETRLWQLASLVKAVQSCIEVGIPAIDAIRPLPPLVQHDDRIESIAFREYPVYIHMRGPFESAVRFLETIRERGRFFTLRSFMMENVSAADDATLEIFAVSSAGLDAIPSKMNERAGDASQDTLRHQSGNERTEGSP